MYPCFYQSLSWYPRYVREFFEAKTDMVAEEIDRLISFIYFNKAGCLNTKGYTIDWMIDNWYTSVEISIRKQ